jgi:triacylglycerol lipase
MLPRILLIWIALELVIFGAVGHWALGWLWPAALAFAVGMILLARALMIGITWRMAWRFASPAPRLSRARAMGMVLREYAAFVFGFCWLQPFEKFYMPADRLRPCAQPILLVHGYGCGRGVWWWLRRELEAAGQVVATLSLEPLWGSIDNFAEQLQQRVQAVCAATQAPRVMLVAHSMGGLVARAYLARHGADRVAGLITIGTPHHGTAIARLGLGLCARQMEQDSVWLVRLTPQPVPVPFVSIRTPQDNFVMPQDTQRHPDAVDEPLPEVGHIAALFDRRMLEIVRKHLVLRQR